MSEVQCCLQGMSVDDSELREYTHGMFGSIAGLLKQDFQPYLATCVAAALASCNQVSSFSHICTACAYHMPHITHVLHAGCH